MTGPVEGAENQPPIPARARRWAGAVAHAVDLSVSVPLPWGRYYVRLVAGKERRSVARLAAEGQTGRVKIALAYLFLALLLLASVLGCLFVLYVIKCALGIKLTNGDAPLHFLYERLFE